MTQKRRNSHPDSPISSKRFQFRNLKQPNNTYPSPPNLNQTIAYKELDDWYTRLLKDRGMPASLYIVTLLSEFNVPIEKLETTVRDIIEDFANDFRSYIHTKYGVKLSHAHKIAREFVMSLDVHWEDDIELVFDSTYGPFLLAHKHG